MPLLAALAALAASACGQSGPLYLPGNPSRVETDPRAAGTGTDEIVEDEAVEEEIVEDDEVEDRE